MCVAYVMNGNNRYTVTAIRRSTGGQEFTAGVESGVAMQFNIIYSMIFRESGKTLAYATLQFQRSRACSETHSHHKLYKRLTQ